MNGKEQKENKVQKETRPVKKSVALVLTIVTVFAFAAACFSLGFCSGKKVEHAYALDVTVNYYYYFNETVSGKSGQFMGDFQCNGRKYSAFVHQSYGDLLYEAYDDEGMISDQLVAWTSSEGWIDNIYRYIYIESALLPSATAQWLSGNSVNTVDATLYPGNYTWKEELNLSLFSSTFLNYYLDFSSGGNDFVAVRFSSTMMWYRYKSDPTSYVFVYDLDDKEHWGSYGRIITISEETLLSPDFYDIFFANMASFSFASAPTVYTLTCEYEGAQNYSITYGMIGEITRNGNVFIGQPGASVYVRITPNDGYIMRSLSYQITDGSVASITPGSSNNYTIVLASSDATVLFSVVATVQAVDISSGYYWMQSRVYGSDFSELTLRPGEFQIVESISNGSISWQDLTGLTCSSGRITFRLAGDRRISVYTLTSVMEEYGFTTGLDGKGAGWIISGNYDYNTTLWSANWYPVIYVPSNIMEGEAPDSLVAFFKSTSIYKAEPVFYNGMYLTSKSAVSTVDPLYNTYLSAYIPSSNTLVSPSGVSFVPHSARVLDANFKSQLAFMGDVGAREYSIYSGYVWQENGTSVGYSRVGRIPPFSNSGTYEESIYIAPTIMPAALYDNMSNWFDISVNPVIPDPPPPSYWDGLDEVLGYEIFGIPLSSLLAIVISSVFVVVVIRLFAGG